MTLKGFLGCGLVSFILFSEAFALPKNIPLNPDLSLTPGDICQKNEASEFRYPERIPYCRRDVDQLTKEDIFDEYDRKYGLRSKGYNRRQFKIDHFVSLCMGGSNDTSNLWPQHLEVAALTDKIEDLLCNQMKAGKIKQAQAIATARRVKLDLSLAASTLERLMIETEGLVY